MTRRSVDAYPDFQSVILTHRLKPVVVESPAGVAGPDSPKSFQPCKGTLDHPASGGMTVLGAMLFFLANSADMRRVAVV